MPENFDLSSPKDIKILFERYNLAPRRQLGQNFLIDGNVVRKIVDAAEVKNADSVIEVGPGAGALTVSLLKLGAKLLVIEIDSGLAGMLRDLFNGEERLTIVEEDVLQVNWCDLIANNFIAGNPIKLISNLPYIISAPFMYGLLKAGFPLAKAVLMFQKEVAQRLVCSPGDSVYGSLSVITQYYTKGKMLFKVSNNVFWPRPKVGSAVIQLEPRKRTLEPPEEPLFWYLVQGAFQQRRKTMLNNMIRLFPDLLRTELAAMLASASIEPSERPEMLSADQFANLTRITYNEHK